MITQVFERQRLRYICKVNPIKGKRDKLPQNTEVSFVPMECIGEQGSLSLERTKPIEEVSSGYTYFEDGDVVFAKITPCFENGKGTLARNLENGIAFGTTELHVLRPYFISNGKFLYYLISSYKFRKTGESYMYGAGGQKRVPEDYVKNFSIPIPPLPLQKVIASYLDKETARIDALIEKKKRQIELLQEKRQAIITRAVTKGLNPNAKMKDSGVEWIGEIPEGWETRRLRHIVSMRSGIGITSEDIKEEGEYPVFGGNGFRGYCQKYTHEGNFVLIGRQGALCGNINYAKGKFWASEHAVVATPVLKVETLWLGEIMRIMNLNQYSISAAQPGLAVDRIKDLIIPVPSYREQEQIATIISMTIRECNDISQLLTSSISLLKEYRSSLITAAVSGQINVSEEVIA